MTAHYVYRVYDSADRLIYVGCCGKPFDRLETHRLQTWWAPQVARVKVSVFPDRTTAFAAEREAIRTEDPRWNITGVWHAHHTWDEARFLDYVTAYVNNRMTSVPPRLTQYGEKHIANVKRRYRIRFGHDLPTPEAAVA